MVADNDCGHRMMSPVATNSFLQPRRWSALALAVTIGAMVVALISRARRSRWRRVVDVSRAQPGQMSRTRASATSRKLLRLRNAIVGNPRSAVLEIFGPPPAVAGTSAESPTWYYPLDASLRRAIAIDFDGDIACAAQFVDAPRHGQRKR